MKVIAAIMGAALVAVIGVSMHFWREIEAGQQQIGELRERLLASESRAPMATASGLPSKAVDAIPSSTSIQADVPEPDVTPSSYDVMRAQRSSPEAAALRLQMARAHVEQSNPDLGEALAIPPEEVGRLLDLLAKQQDEMTFGLRRDKQGNESWNFATEVNKLRKVHDEQLQVLLGSRYALWQDYFAALPAWQQRSDLRAVLAAAGTPLTQTQSRDLIGALAAEHLAFNRESADAARRGEPLVNLMLRSTPERRQRLLGAAAAHLSPQQLDSFRAMLERASTRELSMYAPERLMEQQSGNGAGNVP